MKKQKGIEMTEDVCVKCKKPLKFVLVSSDADGNRPEYWMVCKNSECEECE